MGPLCRPTCMDFCLCMYKSVRLSEENLMENIYGMNVQIVIGALLMFALLKRQL